jgi:hypothetical protein
MTVPSWEQDRPDGACNSIAVLFCGSELPEGVGVADVPVLVVGGPVGLSAALLLGRYGVRSLLVERHGGTSPLNIPTEIQADFPNGSSNAGGLSRSGPSS